MSYFSTQLNNFQKWLVDLMHFGISAFMYPLKNVFSSGTLHKVPWLYGTFRTLLPLMKELSRNAVFWRGVRLATARTGGRSRILCLGRSGTGPGGPGRGCGW